MLNPCSLIYADPGSLDLDPGQDRSAALFLSNVHIVVVQLLSHV